MTSFVVGVRLTADGRSLRGEVDLSEKEFEKFQQAVAGSNRELAEHGRRTDEVEQKHRRSHDTAQLVTSGLRQLGAVAAAYASVQTLQRLGQIADSYTNITTRVRSATEETGDFVATWTELQDVAFRTRTTLESNVDLFQRFAINRQALGATNDQLLQVVETFNILGRVSGASQEDMANASRQLGQALGQQFLRAEEFNSVIEQTPEFIRRIAEEMQLTTAEFGNAVREGRILSQDVLQAALRIAPQVKEELADLPLTIGDAATNMGNALTLAIGRLDQAAGISRSIATALNAAAEAFRPASAGELRQEIARTQLVLDRMVANGRAGSAAYEALARSLEDTKEELAGLEQQGQKASNAIGDVGNETGTATDEFEKWNNEFERLRDQLQPLDAELRQYEQDLNLLEEAFESGRISMEQYLNLKERLWQTTTQYRNEVKENARQEKIAADEANAHVRVYERMNSVRKEATEHLDAHVEAYERLTTSNTRYFAQLERSTAAVRDQTSAFSTLLSVVGGLGVSVPVGGGSINLSSLSALAPLFSGGTIGALGQIGLGAGVGGGIFGGSQNALLGAGLGATGGFFTGQALGPLLTVLLGGLGPASPLIAAGGALLGGLGGGFLGGLFGGNNQVPRIAVEGRPAGAFGRLQGPIGQRSTVATGAFGSVRVGGEDGQGRTREMQVLANRLVALDNMIAERMDPSRVGTAAARANAAVLQSTRAGRFDADLTAFDRVNAAISAAGNELERIWERLDDVDPSNFEQALDATFQLFDFMTEDVPQTFSDMQQAIEQANDSLYESSLRTGQQLVNMALNFDGTAQSAQELAQATAQRSQAEAALLSQIEQVRTAGQAGTDSLREQIRREFETSTQTANRLVVQSQADLDLLRTLEDPSQIAQVSGRIERNLGSAFGLMSPEQREAQQQFFNDMLDTLDEVREGQLDVATTMIERQGTVIREAITEALAEPSTNINTAATALSRASVTLQLAANRIPEEINVVVEPA